MRDPQTVELARERLAAQGFKTALDRTALAEHQRFAGTDAQRLASLTRAAKQKLPIVMVTRGGYGMGRLLHAIDWKAMADSGKRFVGMSDFTAFNWRCWRRPARSATPAPPPSTTSAARRSTT